MSAEQQLQELLDLLEVFSFQEALDEIRELQSSQKWCDTYR